MNYGEILSKAWQIIWKNKVLWIFGILAGCSSNPGNNSTSWRESFQNNNRPEMFGYDMQRLFDNIPVWAWVVLAIVFLVLAAIAIVLLTVGRIGLIKGSADVDAGTAGRLSFSPLFNTSMRYFWRVLLLNILVFFAFLIGGLILIVPLALVFAGLAISIVGILCIVPLACALVVLAWLVNIWIQQSTVALVTEDLGIIDSLKRGWTLVTRNPGQYIVMGIILGVIGFVAAALIGLPLVLVIIPPLMTLAITGDQVTTGLWVSLIMFLIYLPILLVLNGILQSYITSAWTLTFRRLTGRGVTPVEVFVPPSEPSAPAEPAAP